MRFPRLDYVGFDCDRTIDGIAVTARIRRWHPGYWLAALTFSWRQMDVRPAVLKPFVVFYFTARAI